MPLTGVGGIGRSGPCARSPLTISEMAASMSEQLMSGPDSSCRAAIRSRPGEACGPRSVAAQGCGCYGGHALTAARAAPALARDGARRLHIAMVAPPYFRVPPVAYGGIEAVVADLLDTLVGSGHEVTLIGAVSHATRAQRFIATDDGGFADRQGKKLPELVHAAKAADILDVLNADVIHDHTMTGPLTAHGRLTPTVVTAHGPVTGERGDFYRTLGGSVGLIAISDAQRRTAPGLPWTATVHNGIRAETFPFQSDKDNCALFLGRFHPEKAPHLAIDAARAAGMPIILAGKCSEPIE